VNKARPFAVQNRVWACDRCECYNPLRFCRSKRLRKGVEPLVSSSLVNHIFLFMPVMPSRNRATPTRFGRFKIRLSTYQKSRSGLCSSNTVI